MVLTAKDGNAYDEILGELIELDLGKRNNNYEYRKK